MNTTNHHLARNKYGFYIEKRFLLVKFLTKEQIAFLLDDTTQWNPDETRFNINLLRDELKYRTAAQMVSKLMFKLFIDNPNAGSKTKHEVLYLLNPDLTVLVREKILKSKLQEALSQKKTEPNMAGDLIASVAS